MFALRHGGEGKTEGRTIVFTKRRKGVLGKLLSRCVLFFTKIAGRFFSYGDTKVFNTIRFDLQNPIAADKSVLAFMRHVENQNTVEWRA
jgi:hypothetical protein